MSSGSRRPPEPPIFFLDRSLGKKRIATALAAAGAIVYVHDDYFSPDARDEYWLAEVGRNGWVILTKDQKIRFRTIERTALINARVGAFILTAGGLQGDEMARIFVLALQPIRKFLTKHPRPFIARITASGTVSLLYHRDT